MKKWCAWSHIRPLHGDSNSTMLISENSFQLVVAVHEQVQQVDGEMAGRGAEGEAIAHNGNQISKIPPEVQLRRLALVRRQLQLLVPKRLVNIRSQLSSPPLPLQLHGSRRCARPDAATSVRNRGPQSPSPAGVHGAPAAFMPRTVGREAPASARAQHPGARAAHC